MHIRSSFMHTVMAHTHALTCALFNGIILFSWESLFQKHICVFQTVFINVCLIVFVS